MSMSPASEGVQPPRSSLYYRHSGRAPLGALILALALGIAVTVPAAILYAIAVLYIPIIYLNIVLGLGLGAVMGGVPAKLARIGRVRNNARAYAVVLIVALAGFYIAWVAWLWFTLQKSHIAAQPMKLLMHPAAIWQLAQIINVHGTWTLGDHTGDPVGGITLWVVWIAEAAILIGSSLVFAKKALASDPFCENCAQWCGRPRRLGVSPSRDVRELTTQLEAGNFDSIKPLSATPPARQWLAFYHHTCPTCAQLNTLTVKTVHLVKNKKGRDTMNVKTVIDKLLLHPGEAEQLMPPPPPEAPAA